MEGLASALQSVLSHAVAALEYEDKNDLYQSLQEYNSAWCTLSCAFERHGTTSCGGFPGLVHDTCTALLETYSTRYEAIRARLEAENCGEGCEGDVGRSPQITSSSSGSFPNLFGSTSRSCEPPASFGPHQLLQVCNSIQCNPIQPGCPTILYGAEHINTISLAASGAIHSHAKGDSGRCLWRRCEQQQWPPTPNDFSGIGSGAKGPVPAVSDRAGGRGLASTARAGAMLMTELMTEVFQMCHRPVQEGSSLDDLAGLESVKEEVRLALLLPLRMPHLFQGIRQPARNFLLHGPPGTGKTMLVERIAAEAGMTLLVLTPGAILSKWSGESEKQLRAVFDVARALQPCIVFMDEVDSLAPTRGCGDDPIGRRLLNELLVQMSCLASGVVGPRSAVAGPPTPLTNAVDAMGNRYSGNGSGGDGSCDSMSVYVFAATNRIQDCDPALLRRFDRRVAVPLPDVKARETFLAGVLARPEVGDHSLDASELRQLAERTEGYSGSDLAQLCREAVMQPVRELLREMADWGPWGRGSSISTAAAVAPSVAFSGGGDVPGGPRSLGIQDFEWALGVVQPVQPPTS